MSNLPTLGLLGVKGEPRPETWVDLREAMKQVNVFVRSVGGRFLGRQALLEKVKYALCMGEHLLVSGPAGTGKTGLAQAVIGNIQGATIWSSDLSRSMAEVQIFGDFDTKKAQETGVLMHMIEGSILDAHFANLGEFFDANTPLLRALLRVLNEREFRRGAQKIDVPLLTALANTNASPAELRMHDKNDMLGAVIDRFLFHECTGYLVDVEDRRMVLRHRAGVQKPSPIIPIDFKHIKLIVDAIKQLNFVLEDAIVCAYEEIAREFAKERGRPISDRRLVKGIDVLEASAILRGSTEGATWEDLSAVALILVDDPADQGKFDAVAKAVIERARDENAQDAAANETANIDLIMGSVTVLKPDEIGLVPDSDLVRINREVVRAISAMQGFVPASPSAKSYRRTKLDELEAYKRQIKHQMDATS